MAKAARKGDSITGTTSGEHGGHYDEWGSPIHGPCSISGTISSNCSPNVFINGKAAVFIGSNTTESDCCDSGRTGTVSAGSSSVFVNGKRMARINDSITPHNGTGKISGGSPNVFVGG